MGLKGSSLVEPSGTVRELIKEHKLGRKVGCGFYDYGVKK